MDVGRARKIHETVPHREEFVGRNGATSVQPSRWFYVAGNVHHALKCEGGICHHAPGYAQRLCWSRLGIVTVVVLLAACGILGLDVKAVKLSLNRSHQAALQVSVIDPYIGACVPLKPFATVEKQGVLLIVSCLGQVQACQPVRVVIFLTDCRLWGRSLRRHALQFKGVSLTGIHTAGNGRNYLSVGQSTLSSRIRKSAFDLFPV
jgi:hypothetical protein